MNKNFVMRLYIWSFLWLVGLAMGLMLGLSISDAETPVTAAVTEAPAPTLQWAIDYGIVRSYHFLNETEGTTGLTARMENGEWMMICSDIYDCTHEYCHAVDFTWAHGSDFVDAEVFAAMCAENILDHLGVPKQ